MARKISFLLLCLFFISLFFKLSHWQYTRSQEKQQIINLLNSGTILEDPDFAHLTEYTRVKIAGTFDFEHQFLLENQFKDHQVGFHVITPFRINNKDQAILINRGWITTPKTDHLSQETTVVGYFRKPHYTLILGDNIQSNSWPIKIQNIDFKDLKDKVPYKIYTTGYLSLEKPQLNISPEKHFGYAIQWLCLAIVSIIGTIIFFRRI